MKSLVNLLNQHTPIFEPFGTIAVIVGLFLAAWLVSRLAGQIAVRLVQRSERRRAAGEGLVDTGVLQGLRQRQTAISLLQTSIRYVAFGLALLLAVAVAVGAKRIDAVVGASFLAIVVAFAAQRFLTDVIAGLLMFFEGWFRVGDMITIDPWKVQGVVEEVSVRSITIRGIDGDVMHVPNSSVMATRVTPRGVRELEVELYVSDLERGRALVDEVARLVPIGPTHFVRRPSVRETETLGDDLSRITVQAAVPPGREWLAEDFLASLLRERGGEELVQHGPVVLPSDEQALRRFAQLEAGAGTRRHRGDGGGGGGWRLLHRGALRR